MQYYVYCKDNICDPNVTEHPYSCKVSFGLPSLHALSCTAITMYLLLDFIITRKEIGQVARFLPDTMTGELRELPPLHTNTLNNVSAIIILIAGLIYTFFVGFLQWELEVSYLN